MLGGNRVPNSRQHVGNRISHVYSVKRFQIFDCRFAIEESSR
jgi:hypothetical protein